MAYKRFRLFLAKGWTLLVCSVSVAVIALLGSCRSKKINKSAEDAFSTDKPADESVDEFASSRSANGLVPVAELPSDSKEVKEMIRQVNNLKKEMSDRMNSVIYGTPEIMQRRAEENNMMMHQIDSLDNAIRKARQK